MAARKKASEPDFETGLQELTKIVSDMESGKMTLEETLDAYERGHQTARQLEKRLEAARARLFVLSAGEGGEMTEVLEDGGDGSGDSNEDGGDA